MDTWRHASTSHLMNTVDFFIDVNKQIFAICTDQQALDGLRKPHKRLHPSGAAHMRRPLLHAFLRLCVAAA
jgi:hypothetical protein